jgi:DNA-binding transcriptional MerR regulator
VVVDSASRPTASEGRPDPLLTIGVFARRSRLSPKALRLYERLGVLAPAAVDPANGYRRYREGQLATARLVALLRRLEMPLARVAEVVAAPDAERAALVAAYWAEVERRVAAQRELARFLRAKLSGEEEIYDMVDVMVRDVPAQSVLTEQRHLTVGDLEGWITAALGRLLTSAGAAGGPTGAPFVVYHGEVNEESDGPVEACVPIDPSRAELAGSATRTEPAHREAYARITKAQVGYPEILAAYEAVAHWIAANGERHDGSPREVYFTDWATAAPTDEVCDVAFPIR